MIQRSAFSKSASQSHFSESVFPIQAKGGLEWATRKCSKKYVDPENKGLSWGVDLQNHENKWVGCMILKIQGLFPNSVVVMRTNRRYFASLNMTSLGKVGGGHFCS